MMTCDSGHDVPATQVIAIAGEEDSIDRHVLLMCDDHATEFRTEIATGALLGVVILSDEVLVHV